MADSIASIDTQLTNMWATYRTWLHGGQIGMSPLVAYQTLDLLLEQRRELSPGPEMHHRDDIASIGEWGAVG
jgi:hypothetical protein